jgi:FkbM family methyltransferase
VISAYEYFKRLALSSLPESVLQPVRQWHHARVVRAFDETAEPELRVVRHLVVPGAMALDLGANIGAYTGFLSRHVGTRGQVISVEPVPYTFSTLQRNVRVLRLANVTCVNAAVSDREGEALMELPEYPAGGTNYYQARVVPVLNSDHAPAVSVRTTRVDSIVPDPAMLTFVKCDVEGHELAALAGAERVLAAGTASWLIEVAGDPDDVTDAGWRVFRIFETHGYSAWCLRHGRLSPRQVGDLVTNYFFLKPAHVASLRLRAAHLLS